MESMLLDGLDFDKFMTNNQAIKQRTQHDTDTRVDGAEEHSKGVERLIGDNAAFGCYAYFDSNLVFHEICTLRIPPTGEESDPSKSKLIQYTTRAMR